jgi:hypothetical protein
MRVRLKTLFVSYSPEQDASESDVDHGFGTVDALFVVEHEATPAGHPGERELDDPTTRDDRAGFENLNSRLSGFSA